MFSGCGWAISNERKWNHEIKASKSDISAILCTKLCTQQFSHFVNVNNVVSDLQPHLSTSTHLSSEDDKEFEERISSELEAKSFSSPTILNTNELPVEMTANRWLVFLVSRAAIFHCTWQLYTSFPIIPTAISVLDCVYTTVWQPVYIGDVMLLLTCLFVLCEIEFNQHCPSARILNSCYATLNRSDGYRPAWGRQYTHFISLGQSQVVPWLIVERERWTLKKSILAVVRWPLFFGCYVWLLFFVLS